MMTQFASLHVRWILLFLFAVWPFAHALAWNAAGHRISAAIAWQHMSPATQEKARALLALHPSHPEWLRALARGKRPQPATPMFIFAEASTWADDIRRDERFSDVSDSDNATDARHRDWHYVNWPVDSGFVSPSGKSGVRREGQLNRLLLMLPRSIANLLRPDSQRSRDLVWLIHLVGDAHQPLHTASLPDGNGDQDPGGLGYLVRDASRTRFSVVSLHAWWDDLPGPPWLRGERLSARIWSLLERHPGQSVDQKTPSEWLKESLVLAGSPVRPPTNPDLGVPWLITEAYRAQAILLADRRLVESGVRLGRLLEALLGNQKASRYLQPEDNGVSGVSTLKR